jgi:biotin carboxylase
MTRVLVLGGGLTQCDAIRTARRLSLDVVVADGNPEAPGMRTGDPGVTGLEVSFADVEGVLREVRRRGLRLDAVLPYGSDLSVAPAARLAEELGLRGIGTEAARACTDKTEMRRRWARAGVPVLPHAEARDAPTAVRHALAIGLPVVVKPPDNAAQRGVQRVDDPDRLEAAVVEALASSPSGRVLVEEHVDGPELAVTTFACGGRALAVQVTDRVTGPPPYLGICLAHVFPTELQAAVLSAVESTTLRAAEALGVRDGPTYSQVRVRDGVPYVLETGARLGGGRDSELRSFLADQDYIAVHLTLLLDGTVDVERELDPSALSGGGCVRFLVAPPGRLVDVEGWDELGSMPSVRSRALFYEPGSRIPDLRSGEARLGYLVTIAPSRSEAVAEAERAASRLGFVVETLAAD